MPFNINEFKSKMDQYGGPAKNNLFLLELGSTDSSFIDSRDLRFFCKSVTMPGVNLSVADYNPRNFGLSEKIPVGINQDPLNAVFILDNSHRVISFFHEWMRFVLNFNGNGIYNTNTRNTEQLPYELNYKSDYAVSMFIRHFSTTGVGQFYDCRLEGVYPTEIQPAALSWDDGEVSTLSVNFSYSSIEFIGYPYDVSQTTTSEAQGQRLIDYYKSIGNNALAIQQEVNTQAGFIRPFRIKI